MVIGAVVRVETMVIEAVVRVETVVITAVVRVETVVIGGVVRVETMVIVQELCESRGGRPGLSVPTSFVVSVDVKHY